MENSKTACRPNNWSPVAYKGRSCMRGSNLKSLTGNILVFWMLWMLIGEFTHVQCPCDEG